MNKKTATKANSSQEAPVENKGTSKPASKAILKKAEPSQEQIAVRAYFISEQRQKTGRAGDHLSDWKEAEQQLIDEAK